MSAIKLLMSDQLTFMSTLIGYVEMYQLAFHENYFIQIYWIETGTYL